MEPSTQPSSRPSIQPSMQPSARPSTLPTMQPSSRPSTIPTLHPSAQPSSQPTVQPSHQPSSRPSGFPSCQPSVQPSGKSSMCVHTSALLNPYYTINIFLLLLLIPSLSLLSNQSYRPTVQQVNPHCSLHCNLQLNPHVYLRVVQAVFPQTDLLRDHLANHRDVHP